MRISHETLAAPNDPTPWLLVQPNEDKEFCVLWLQGWTSTIEKHEPLVTHLADQTGLTFAMLNYAGHGTHPIPLEHTTRKQQFEEVLFAYDHLQEMGYKRIIVAGNSFGSYLTALLTAKRTPFAVILRAPAIYEDDEFALPFPECEARRIDNHRAKFRNTVTATSEIEPLSVIRNYGGWTYVVEHELDSVIPANIPRSYFEAAQHGNYLIIPATDHAPALMPEPEKHFHYIEVVLLNLLQLIVLSSRFSNQ